MDCLTCQNKTVWDYHIKEKKYILSLGSKGINMHYIVFNNHPADIIKCNCEKGIVESFLMIGNKFLPIRKIGYRGKEKFVIYCKFPTHKIDREFVRSMLTKMQLNHEILEFNL